MIEAELAALREEVVILRRELKGMGKLVVFLGAWAVGSVVPTTLWMLEQL